MREKRAIRLLSLPKGQMFVAALAFVAASILIEPGGLAKWADHLECWPLRAVAVPVTAAIDRALKPLGADRLRETVQTELARLGWSDDAARMARIAHPELRERLGAPGRRNLPEWLQLADLPPAGSRMAIKTSRGAAAVPGRTPGISGQTTTLAANVPRRTELPPLPPVDPSRPRVVALAGDSMMAVGLSTTLMRQAAGHRNLRIVKAFRSGTGLARPEVFNWMDEYPAMLGQETPDVVIVAIGANDGQGFVEDGKVMPYGSADWQRVYRQRLADFLDLVSADGARVVWVGLPPMRAAAYNERIAAINRIAYTVVSENPQSTWWNPVSFVGDDAGAFREFAMLANGRTMRLRQPDGIHLSDEGAGLLTNVLMPWLDPPAKLVSPAEEPASEPRLNVPAPATAPAQIARAALPRRRARRKGRG